MCQLCLRLPLLTRVSWKGHSSPIWDSPAKAKSFRVLSYFPLPPHSALAIPASSQFLEHSFPAQGLCTCKKISSVWKPLPSTFHEVTSSHCSGLCLHITVNHLTSNPSGTQLSQSLLLLLHLCIITVFTSCLPHRRASLVQAEAIRHWSIQAYLPCPTWCLGTEEGPW